MTSSSFALPSSLQLSSHYVHTAMMESALGQDSQNTLLPTMPRELKPVAIVGMACRLPAGATNVENLWKALASGQSGWSLHPEDRHMPSSHYHPNAAKLGCYNAKGAHYLEENIARFDAQLFNVKPAEATVRPQDLWSSFWSRRSADQSLSTGNRSSTAPFARNQL